MRFIVKGKSMEPNFRAGDKLYVSKLAYQIRGPRVGEVAVLQDPRDGRLLLKRIGEIRDKFYFVSGDNSAASTDSSEFGAVYREQFVGRFIFRYSS